MYQDNITLCGASAYEKKFYFNQDFNADFKEVASKAIPFFEYDEKLQVWGRFNALNAGLAAAIATELKIPKDIIMESLADFKAVEGRMNVYKINNASIFVGKTDNLSLIHI